MNILRVLVGLAAVGSTVSASAQSYRFDIDPDRSYTDGYVQIRMWMAGSFRGDYDSEKNPKGTRTKAGSEGDFKAFDNGAVLAKPFFEFHNSSVLRSSGTFDLTVDLDNKKAILNAYKVQRLASGPVTLNGQCALYNEPFRTADPPALYNPELTTFGVGQAQLHRLTFTQRPGARIGTVTELGNDWYRVSVTFMADVEVDIMDLNQQTPMTFTMAASLVGNFHKTADGATFGYPRGQGGDNLVRELDVPLDDFPLTVPAGTDPQGNAQKAKVRLLASVGKVAVAINGIRELSAKGTPIDFWMKNPHPTD